MRTLNTFTCLLCAFLLTSSLLAGCTTVSYNSGRQTSTGNRYDGYEEPSATSVNRSVTSAPSATLDYPSFYDLFAGVPIRRFTPEKNKADTGIIENISYVPVGGWCCGTIINEDIVFYEPLDDMYGICDEGTSARYTFSDSDGRKIISTGTCPKDTLVPVPDYISHHLGQYKMLVESSGTGTKHTYSFKVGIPNAPRTYYEQSRLYLINFHSQEFVNVYCFSSYDPVSDMFRNIVSNVFKTDTNGKLVVDSLHCEEIVVNGARTGVVYKEGNIPLVVYRKTWRPFDNCPASRLNKGDITAVSFEPPLCNRVRAQPGTSSAILECIDPGTELQVIDGPSCNNGMLWWKVKGLDVEVSGWTAEGDGENFWLQPGIMPNSDGHLRIHWPDMP